MLLKYFNGNKLSVFITIPLLMVLCWVPFILDPLTEPVSGIASWGILGKYITVFSFSHQQFASIIAMLIIMGNGFLLLQINAIHIFIPMRTQIPALFYMLLCSAFPDLGRLSPALVASSLIIILLFRVFAAYKKESLSYNFLDAGLLLSLASLFYIPVVLFYPVLLAIMVIIRPYIWREWIYTLIGLLLPYIFILCFQYLAEISIAGNIEDIKRTLSTGFETNVGKGTMAFVAYMVLLIIIGSINMMRSIGTVKIHSGKFFMCFFWFFIASLLIYYLVPASGIEMIYFTSIPVSFLIGYYFTQGRKSRLKNIILILFFIGIIAVKVLG